MQDEYDFIIVRGTKRFRKNKRMVSKNVLPRDVMERFGLIGETVQSEQAQDRDAVVDPKACIFCGVHSRLTRFVDVQTIYVCDEHYYSENIGKCAQKLRELQHA